MYSPGSRVLRLVRFPDLPSCYVRNRVNICLRMTVWRAREDMSVNNSETLETTDSGKWN